MPHSRRSLLKASAAGLLGLWAAPRFSIAQEKLEQLMVMTVNGPIDKPQMGLTLVHEHLLVDFGGAAKFDPARWDREKVALKVLPYLAEAKRLGLRTFIDCTPNYVGRDARLLRLLAERSGIHILTNTGYYGGSDHKFLPDHAFTETDRQLADRWIREWTNGIGDTGIRPGFIKISVNNAKLSDISGKLVRAAAIAHLETGLTINSHTGPAVPALEQIELLKSVGVSPSALVWTHAQNETDWKLHATAAKHGAWVSLDGLDDKNVDTYVRMLRHMKDTGSLHRTLISHDAGWYRPGQPDGGMFRGFNTLFEKLLPALRQANFDEADLHRLLHDNPWQAYAVAVRRAE